MASIHYLPSVDSTQDEARRLLQSSTNESNKTQKSCFAITATEQLKGRGTSGRDWIGRKGNVFVTICIPSDSVTIMPTLLPLKIGSVVAQHVQHFLSSSSSSSLEKKVTVKWPNDVLINGGKVAGIGINVAHAPPIDSEGRNKGRISSCLFDYISSLENEEEGVTQSKELVTQIVNTLSEWIDTTQHLEKDVASECVIAEWSQWAEFGKEVILRDEPTGSSYASVKPIRVEPDGRLRVLRRDGKE
eukprot:9826773-Ditylum_brightwellii.AAC.1